VTVEICLKNGCVWADAGHVVASEQFPLICKHKEEACGQHCCGKADSSHAALKTFKEARRYVTISNDGFLCRFNDKTGALIALQYNGKEMLKGQRGPEFNWYRSISNDPLEWEDGITVLDDFSYAPEGDDVKILAKLHTSVCGQTVNYRISYLVRSSGAIDVKAEFDTPADFTLPRLGLQTMLDPSLEYLEWFGRGPMENYRDRKDAAFVGLWSSTVEDMKENYVRAQTMGERCDTRYLTLTDSEGKGIMIRATGEGAPATFDFSALHYTDKDLWNILYGHDLDKIRRQETVLNLDAIQKGIGNASCGPDTLPKYCIKPGTTYTLSFTIESFSKFKTCSK